MSLRPWTWYDDGHGGLDTRLLCREGYFGPGPHKASRLFSTWLARLPGVRQLVEESNTTLCVEDARTRRATYAIAQ